MEAQAPTRIAAWSGPRNISTALLRSWGNRSDTIVADEPFYAHYLAVTGANHPDAANVIAAGQTDVHRVVASLLGPLPQDRPVFYQKHMTHHMLEDVPTDWMASVNNIFVIRRPDRVLASLHRVLGTVTLEQTGLPQQIRLFEVARRLGGGTPPVVDADQILADPAHVLQDLCRQIGVGYQNQMESWKPGSRPTDGIWGRHWYGRVNASSGFAKPSADEPVVASSLKDVASKAWKMYHKLARHITTVAH